MCISALGGSHSSTVRRVHPSITQEEQCRSLNQLLAASRACESFSRQSARGFWTWRRNLTAAPVDVLGLHHHNGKMGGPHSLFDVFLWVLPSNDSTAALLPG